MSVVFVDLTYSHLRTPLRKSRRRGKRQKKNLLLRTQVPPTEGKQCNEPSNDDSVVHVRSRHRVRRREEENDGNEEGPHDGDIVDWLLPSAQLKGTLRNGMLVLVIQAPCNDGDVGQIHRRRRDTKDAVDRLDAAEGNEVEAAAEDDHGPDAEQWCLGILVHLLEMS